MGDAERPSTPLLFDDVVRVLGAMGRVELVLVAGQAVAAWAHRYARLDRLPELSGADEIFVSTDVDCLVEPQDILASMRALAEELDGEAELDKLAEVGGQELPPPAPNAAIVTFTDSNGAKRRVDVLGELYGVDARDVLSTAVEVVGPSGELAFYQHPVSLVASRLANCVGLEKYRTGKGRRQAEVAILVLREWLVDVAQEDPRDARHQVADLYDVCMSEVGLRAFDELGLDAWEGVEACIPHLGEGFAMNDLPRKVEALVSARDAWTARRS